jgi:ABC-type sugar transport system ATPase subunit
VAAFLGSPPINIWPAVLRPDGVLTAAGVAFGPGPTGRSAEADIGVRPEDVEVFKDSGPGRVEGRVLLCEPMGNETIVTLLSEGQRVVARATADFAIRPGSPAFFTVSPGKALFFEAESGRRLA